MKKLIVCVAVLAVSAFLFARVSYAAEFTDRDREIYYDLITGWGEIDEMDIPQEERAVLYQKSDAAVAAKYGVTADFLHDLAGRAFYRDLTDKEVAIALEREKLVEPVVDDLSHEEYYELLAEVGNKFGVSAHVVEDINGRYTYVELEKWAAEQEKKNAGKPPAPGTVVRRYVGSDSE